MTEKVDRISEQELNAIKEAQNKAVLAATQAERAVALSQAAEAQAKNVILEVFNKYGLKAGEDQLLADGRVVLKEEPQAEAQVQEGTTEG